MTYSFVASHIEVAIFSAKLLLIPDTVKLFNPHSMIPSRIAVVCPSISRQAGGLFESVRRLTLSISQSPEFEPVPFAISDDNSLDDIGKWAPLVPRLSKSYGPKKAAFGPNLPQELAKFAPDLIHSHGIWQYPTFAVDRHHSYFKPPVIISPRGMLDKWALMNSPWIKRLVLSLFQRKQLRKNVACLHALCDSEARSIRDFGCTAPIAVVPNGAQLPSNQKVLRRLGTSNRCYLLFMGRLHHKKGVLELIRAWASISPARKNKLQLVIAGTGEKAYLKQIASQIQSLQMSMCDSIEHWTNGPDIILTGDVREELKESLLFHSEGSILPSSSEGLPVSVLEAWSYGKPVLMTRACNIPEGFAANAAIEIVAHSALEAGIKDSLVAFAAMSTAEQKAIGQNGRRLIESKFNWDMIGSDMTGVYRWLLGRGNQPSCVRMD